MFGKLHGHFKNRNNTIMNLFLYKWIILMSGLFAPARYLTPSKMMLFTWLNNFSDMPITPKNKLHRRNRSVTNIDASLLNVPTKCFIKVATDLVVKSKWLLILFLEETGFKNAFKNPTKRKRLESIVIIDPEYAFLAKYWGSAFICFCSQLYNRWGNEIPTTNPDRGLKILNEQKHFIKKGIIKHSRAPKLIG